MLLLLPGLVLFVLAVVVARLLTPLLRRVEWTGPRAACALRLALLSLARSPGRVVLSDRLLHAQHRHRAVRRRLPRDARARRARAGAVRRPRAVSCSRRASTQLVTRAGSGDGEAVRVARTRRRRSCATRATSLGGAGRDFTLLALPAAAIARVDGWRSDFADQTPSELARVVAPAQTAASARRRAAAEAATRLTVPLDVDGDPLGVALVVLNRRGDFSTLSLGQLAARLAHRHRGAAAAAAAGPRRGAPLLPGDRRLRRRPQGERHGALGVRRSDRRVAIRPHTAGPVCRRSRAGSAAAACATTSGAVHYLLNRAADSILRPHEPLEGTSRSR